MNQDNSLPGPFRRSWSLIAIAVVILWRAAHRTLIVTTMIVTIVVTTLGNEGILLAKSEVGNLLNGLVPIALAIALVSPARLALEEYSHGR